jgi:hypothetical protein
MADEEKGKTPVGRDGQLGNVTQPLFCFIGIALIAVTIMDSDSETTLQASQGRRRLPFVFLNTASRSSSNTSSTQSTPLGSFSFFQSPVQTPHVEMYASPPPLRRSQNYRKLSPALASSPHLFTPPLPVRGALTPGLSPIDRSPRPPRPVHTSVRVPTRRPFLEKLLNVMDGSEDGLASGIDEDESSPPPSSFHLGCTSTPPRATPRQSISPFTSPLSTSSSLEIPLSCVPSPLHRRGRSPTGERQRSGTPPLSVTLKRPRTVKPLTRRENKRLKISAPKSPLVPSSVHSDLRTFPPSIPIHSEFPGFYIRFPVIPPVLKAYLSSSLPVVARSYSLLALLAAH